MYPPPSFLPTPCKIAFLLPEVSEAEGAISHVNCITRAERVTIPEASPGRKGQAPGGRWQTQLAAAQRLSPGSGLRVLQGHLLWVI